MRHTAATFASPKVSQKVLSELLGHRDVKTTERYQHLQVDQLHDALGKIEDVAGKQAERERRNPKRKRDRQPDLGPRYDALQAKMDQLMNALEQKTREPAPSVEDPKEAPRPEPRTRRALDVKAFLKATPPADGIPLNQAEAQYRLDKRSIKKAIVEGRIDAGWGHKPPKARKCLFVSRAQCEAERRKIDLAKGKPMCRHCGRGSGHTPTCSRPQPPADRQRTGPSF